MGIPIQHPYPWKQNIQMPLAPKQLPDFNGAEKDRIVLFHASNSFNSQMPHLWIFRVNMFGMVGNTIDIPDNYTPITPIYRLQRG